MPGLARLRATNPQVSPKYGDNDSLNAGGFYLLDRYDGLNAKRHDPYSTHSLLQGGASNLTPLCLWALEQGAMDDGRHDA